MKLIDIISDKEFDEFLLPYQKAEVRKLRKDLSSRIFLINSMQLNNDIAFNSELTCNLYKAMASNTTVDEKYIRKLMKALEDQYLILSLSGYLGDNRKWRKHSITG